MLKPEEQQVFADLVTRLESADPDFRRRAARPPQRWAVIAVLLWSIAPICIVYGGWTGLIEAVLAGIYGTHLMQKRKKWAAAAESISASGRR
ncbi:DUF3040 domain-containing protein [Actinoplanes sp. NPDC023801]|uniref:DUF3040 domain-containing protein n=1 Tax=Actinoplanes sp. NPDC023801 TaxID=3154595 RepID=UPI0034110E8E